MQEVSILLFKDFVKSFLFSLYYKLPNYPSYPKAYKYFDSYRNFIHKRFLKELGEKTFLRDNVRFTHNRNISIGDNGIVGPNTILNAVEKITIGHDFLGGPELIIYTAEHGLENGETPFSQQSNTSAPVTIGNNVYVGARVIILKGVTVGDNVVIGSGSVVTRNLESNAIYAGNPAKLIKKLSQ